jgi:hypothetical protein
MRTRISSGRAYVDGTYVADVQVREEWVERQVRVPLPGHNSDGYKDLSHAGPAFIQFTSVSDDEITKRLGRLIEFATGDVTRKRAVRDAGGSRVGVDLKMDDGRTFLAASVSSPLTGGGVTSVAFPIHLPDAT